ncbi:MAG: HAD family phosphatase [Candidatus Diapherotrites archaeon]|nr:HAD family phosphatase [Candidatus Diapherotrites archaeon]
MTASLPLQYRMMGQSGLKNPLLVPENMPIKGVLFDLDGLLVDTEPVLARAAIHALNAQNVFITPEEFYGFWTRQGKNIVDFVREKNIQVNIGEYRAMRKKAYLEWIEKELILMPGAQESVRLLSKTHALALVSSSYRVFLHRILELTGLQPFFGVVIACEDVKHEKPAPDGFLLAAQKLGLNPDECVVVEDAEKGVLAAKAAGMKCIAVPNGLTRENDFSKADLILSNLRELSNDTLNNI